MKLAIVMGGGECLFSDLDRTFSLIHNKHYTTFVINDIITKVDRVDNMVTLHPEKLAVWLAKRKGEGRPPIDRIWAHDLRRQVTHAIKDDWLGSSGLFACRVALETGFDTIILNGVPMSEHQGHLIRREPWKHAKMFLRGWERNFRVIQPYVRSWSGWTAELLGQPSAEWLDEIRAKYLRTSVINSDA